VIEILAQKHLFQAVPSRSALREVRRDLNFKESPLRINVWRNHAFEPLIPLVEAYFCLQPTNPMFELSQYDDTLTFSGWKEADLEVIWLDSTRYLEHTAFGDWVTWFRARLAYLRLLTGRPVIVATWFEEESHAAEFECLVQEFPSIHFADIGFHSRTDDYDLSDSRLSEISGTRLGRDAQTLVSRRLACHWIPAATEPPIKAVVVDLDNTIYSGVLGEDGTEGLELTPGHAHFQEFLKSLQQRGVYLAILSRNDLEDVKILFQQRLDFPLRIEDFSSVDVSWGPKSEGMARISSSLLIDHTAILFVDDNIGELLEVKQAMPQVNLVLADSDAETTTRRVDFFPGLWRWTVGADDLIRVQDLQARTERQQVARESHSTENYLRKLETTLTIKPQNISILPRVSSLSMKTNQFNLALQRLTEAQILSKVQADGGWLTTVELSDKISNSGVVGFVLATKVLDVLVVQEVCISCRALGRNLEDAIVITAVQKIFSVSNSSEIAFKASLGPRNGPGIDWLQRWVQEPTITADDVYRVSLEAFLRFRPSEDITLVTSEGEK